MHRSSTSIWRKLRVVWAAGQHRELCGSRCTKYRLWRMVDRLLLSLRKVNYPKVSDISDLIDRPTYRIVPVYFHNPQEPTYGRVSDTLTNLYNPCSESTLSRSQDTSFVASILHCTSHKASEVLNSISLALKYRLRVEVAARLLLSSAFREFIPEMLVYLLKSFSVLILINVLGTWYSHRYLLSYPCELYSTRTGEIRLLSDHCYIINEPASW